MTRETIDLRELLEFLAQRWGMQDLASTVDECYRSWFHRAKAGRWSGSTEYLKHCEARGLYDAVKQCTTSGAGLTIDQMSAFIRRVRMPANLILKRISGGSDFPFEHFVQGSLVTVFVTKRLAQNREGQGHDAGWSRASHGSRDVLAIADLANVLTKRMRLEYRLNLVPVLSYKSDAADSSDVVSVENSAEELLEREMKRRRVGAIVTLGSGAYNPVSNAIARRIFNDCVDDLPVRFRWTDQHRQRIDFLNQTEWLASEAPQVKSGIWCLSEKQAVLLERESDAFIRGYLREPTNRRRYFYDCGMLAIDVRGKVPLILAAGHGGNATRACIKSLEHSDVLNRPELKHLGGRLVACLVVARRKSDDVDIDDLELPKGKAWHFVDEDPPDTHGLSKAPRVIVPRRK